VGSNYNNTDKAGVFNTNINNAPTDTNVNISFRAASQHLLLKKRVTEASASVQVLVDSTEYKKRYAELVARDVNAQQDNPLIE
jgi:hypothetical protein